MGTNFIRNQIKNQSKMSNKKKPKYIQDFERSTKLLIDMFCKKQETEVEHIVKDDVTGIYCIGDNFFSLGDIYFDMINDKPKGLIFEWQNHVTEWNLEHNSNCSINYDSYCMGARFGNQIKGKWGNMENNIHEHLNKP